MPRTLTVVTNDNYLRPGSVWISPTVSPTTLRRCSKSESNLVTLPDQWTDIAPTVTPDSAYPPLGPNFRRNSRNDVAKSPSFCEHALKTFRPQDLDYGPSLGSGFFGEVFLVTDKCTALTMVMKKFFDKGKRSDGSRKFLKEVTVLRQCQHPNVLKYIGVVYDKDKRVHLLTEYITGGSLNQLIANKDYKFTWTDRVAVARDVAAGMDYLHSMHVIHRDLNSGNILIRVLDTTDAVFKPASAIQAVVADFGLVCLTSGIKDSARAHNEARPRKHKMSVGTPFHKAPEMLNEDEYDQRVDIFSFGITVCEIIGRITADPEILIRRDHDWGVDEDAFFAHHTSPKCPLPFVAIAFQCAQVCADKRPPFSTVHEWLNNVASLQQNHKLRQPNHDEAPVPRQCYEPVIHAISKWQQTADLRVVS